ncbi:MAG: polysaccharide deacetylase family protein [Aggregatilineales bacterium]
MPIPLELSILMYHSIADNPKDLHAIHPAEFERQMAALSRQKVRVVDLMEALQRLRDWKLEPCVVITFDDALKDFLTTAVPILTAYHFPATMFVPTGLVGGTAEWDSYDKSKPLLNWDELQEVQRLGFSIGSHTVSHARLVNCDAAQLDAELRRSLETLQQRLPAVAPVLAYPGGFYSPREMRAAHQAGYIGCVGVSSRIANYPWTNRYRLRRRKWIQ